MDEADFDYTYVPEHLKEKVRTGEIFPPANGSR